jgi:DNA-binding NarL/FixJ family response regulator
MKTHVVIYAMGRLQRAAWSALIERQPGIEVAGGAASPAELTQSVKAGQNTAVLLDAPVLAREPVNRLVAAAPGAGLLFLVDAYDLEAIVSLLRAGAIGVIHRDAHPGDLARSLVAAGRGEIVLPPELAGRALAALARGEVRLDQPGDRLTDREQEVLTLLAQGMTNKDIAQSLVLSVRTVEAHLRNVYGKLDVSSRTEAALWAVNNGYGAGNPADLGENT